MMRINIIIMYSLLICTCVSAQVGIGAGGGLFYPGFSESDLNGSRFVTGGGYEFFARHKLLALSSDFTLHAKYAYQYYFSDINLPYTQQTRFTFNFLTISVFLPLFEWNSVHMTGGGGLGLLTVNASKDLLAVTESVLVPHIQVGAEKNLGRFFNLYVDLLIQFGSFPVRNDNLLINGLRVIAGFTMFLSE